MNEHPMNLDQAHAICAAIFEPARGQELEHAARAALERPELRARLLEVGVVPSWKSSAEFADFLKRDAPKWENIVRASGAKVE